MEVKTYVQLVIDRLTTEVEDPDWLPEPVRTVAASVEARPLTAERRHRALFETVFAIDPPEKLLTSFLEVASQPSPDAAARLLLKLAWAKGGCRTDGKRSQYELADLAVVFRLFLANLDEVPEDSPRPVSGEDVTFARDVMARWGMHLMDPENILVVADRLATCSPRERACLIEILANRILQDNHWTRSEFEAIARQILQPQSSKLMN